MILTSRLLSEPLWSNEHGYKGLCISVEVEGESARGLILQYPYPVDKFGSPLPLPQRPHTTVKIIERDIQMALDDGWKPLSRGKTFLFFPS